MELAYLELLRRVLRDGRVSGSRAVLQSTGTRPNTRSLFGAQIRADLADGFPLLTTKQVAFDKVAAELLWMLAGSTDNRVLEAAGVRIWRQWADPETGELGPIYGQQWRRWRRHDGSTVDQIAELLANIRAVRDNPQHAAARRLVVSAWNPGDLRELPASTPMGCHTLFQMHVAAGRLSCQLYQRSADMFLGVPWNIAAYALLTCMLAAATELQPGEFVHTFGDAHIYENHLPQVEEQLGRTPYPPPRLEIVGETADLFAIGLPQLRLHGYQCHPGLRGEVAV